MNDSPVTEQTPAKENPITRQQVLKAHLETQESNKNPSKNKGIDVLSQAIERTSTHLNIDKEELILWLDQQAAPLYTQLQLLRMAQKYQLDPLSDEVGIFEHEDQTQGVYITIDGWAKIMNQHTQYAGMSLRESTEHINNIPTWMECTIYRNDRILPIIVKEYFEEVRTAHPSWQQMPRRMLRHRVIQQCARLALGISCPESSYKSSDANTIQSSPIKNNTEKIKKLLRK